MNNENKIIVGQDTERIKFNKDKKTLTAVFVLALLVFFLSIYDLVISHSMTVRIVIIAFDFLAFLMVMYLYVRWMKFWQRKGMI
jgi:hypothetical protein